MKGKPLVKFWDMVIIILALFLTGFSAFTVYGGHHNTTQVFIQSRNQQWVFPLDADETVTVRGPLGDTVIRIHERQAWVESSPCENQICVSAGHIRSRGIWVACLPNSVFLMIEGKNESKDQIDSVAW